MLLRAEHMAMRGNGARLSRDPSIASQHPSVKPVQSKEKSSERVDDGLAGLNRNIDTAFAAHGVQCDGDIGIANVMCRLALRRLSKSNFYARHEVPRALATTFSLTASCRSPPSLGIESSLPRAPTAPSCTIASLHRAVVPRRRSTLG